MPIIDQAEALRRVAVALLSIRQCVKCRGTLTVRVQRFQIFDTDSADEIRNAYQPEPCPECRKILSELILLAVEETREGRAITKEPEKDRIRERLLDHDQKEVQAEMRRRGLA